MSIYDSFYASVLPGNYALTKSMELTKTQTSGTLWYTKKFLVLYYYVFLSDELMTRQYILNVQKQFDAFISSLPSAVQKEAEQFFYPEEDTLNFKSNTFKTFSCFASFTDFDNEAERIAYEQSARKMYFTLLMGSGGQTGVKKKLKEKVCSPGFIYSKKNLEEAISDAAQEVCLEQIGAGGAVTDNSVKYIFSQQILDEMQELASKETLTIEKIKGIVSRHIENTPRYSSIENDMLAFIRNERQILYYFGYFHSRTAGATDEFSSLTPVGELALCANSQEFLVVWEHQKIKMISQPPIVDINDVATCCNSRDNFSISYTPYTDILGHILRNGSLNTDQYRYIVSRRSHRISENDWIAGEKEILQRLPDLKKLIDGFGRKRDTKSEDGRKELLKYLLGLRADLPKDAETHCYGIVRGQSDFSAIESGRLDMLYKIYFGLETYKVKRYQALFEQCEDDLKRRYSDTLDGHKTSVDKNVKSAWDLYNINADKIILLAVAIAETAIFSDIDLLKAPTGIFLRQLIALLKTRYPSLLRRLGLKSGIKTQALIRKIIIAMHKEDYSALADREEQEHRQVLSSASDVIFASTKDLRKKIEERSRAAGTAADGERVRDLNLVSLLKAYYMACYSEDDFLKCECCGERTFLTCAGEPYLEFHHLIPFRLANGPDHYLNLFALCPTCHRKLHFMRLSEKQPLYHALGKNNYLHMDFVQRLSILKEQRQLRSYQLEYLYAENAITAEEYENIAG